jgi:hypothetical protein
MIKPGILYTKQIGQTFWAVKRSNDGEWAENGVVTRIQLKSIENELGHKGYRLVFFSYCVWLGFL